MANELVPHNDLAVDRFGKGNERKLKGYLVMLASFLGGFGENTRRTYRTGLRQFFELFEWICPEDVTPAHGAAFKKWLLEHRCVSESTAYYRLSAVSSFFDHLCQYGPDAVSPPLLVSNPLRAVARNDIQPTPYAKARAMEWDTFRQILDSIPQDSMGMRDRAILLFFAFTGRRSAEVANLRVRDLNLSSRPRTYTCKVKGGAYKTFELPDICYDAIKSYWIIADRLDDLGADSAVFVAERLTPMNSHLDPDKPLSTRSVRRIVRQRAINADVDIDTEATNLHSIRHMSARDLDKAGVRLQDIQDFLGHASPNTTQIYLDRLGKTAPAHTDALLRVRAAAEKLADELVE